MARRSNAPYWIITHFGGRCHNCRRGIRKGEQALRFPDSRQLLCCYETCGPRAESELKARAEQEAQFAPLPSA